MKMFEKLLKQTPIFKDIVTAISTTTKTLNDLVKGYTQLAKMVIEDRQAINDLYSLHSELILERDMKINQEKKQSTILDVNFSSEDETNKKKMLN